MRRLLWVSLVAVVAIPVQVPGAIVYSGAQNAVVQLSPMVPMSSMGIDPDTHSVVIDGWAYEDPPGVAVAAGEGPCDWFVGGPHKMHWPQTPDLSPAGVDVGDMGTVLADDFMCTASGPIARIHFWGSFAQDLLPERGADAVTFEVRIYSDVPAQANGPSRPGAILWTRTFAPTEYSVRTVHDGPEGWFDPLKDSYQQENHRQAYQYNICVDKEPFVQEEGTVYWLAVRVLDPANSPYQFGSKSTCPELRWNDDAVYQAADGSWRPLVYPKGHENAGQTLDLAFVVDSGRDLPAAYDLGDAPDSSNSLGVPMTAYPKGGPPSVTADFPTVYRAGSPPYGPVHLDPKGRAFLGAGVTLENEADIGPDADPSNNLDVLADVPDADGSDDGVTVPLVLPSGQKTTFDYVVTVVSPSATRLYANVWFDWNRDGDWDDTITLPDGTEVPEWAVQNQSLVLPGVGVHTLTTPPFVCWHEFTQGDLDPIWMRITLSDTPWDDSFGAGGAGPANGYRAGETEDYYFVPKNEPAPAAFDWGDAPDEKAVAGYATLSAHSGARHPVAGPWLGDWSGGPDAEGDGQPDPNALGDDLDGNDDEQGVTIPPLVQGEPAMITVEVSGGGGILQGWIDFNGDMTWQPGEQVCNGYLPDGVHVLTVFVPPDAVVGQSFARFRISTTGGLNPEGPAANGEVEDYDVSIRAAPPQLKLVQWPDLTSNGIDIRVDNSDGKTRWLADDFQCTSTNRITEVRLWGSWKNDRQGKIQKIHLSICADDPAGAAGFDKQNRFSKPAPDVLWSQSFGPGEFTETAYHVVRDPGEWWWDPALGQLAPGGDTDVWQIDVSISPSSAFLQQGSPASPIIYWLQVRVETTDGQFGWKTRRWPDHYMDDAVWDMAADQPAAWKELRYPKKHPYYCREQNSIDMAFALTYTEEVLEHPTTRPGSVTQCPVVETRCPAVETRCPAVKTQCPMVATRCPTTRTMCPPLSTLCPTVATRCPMVKTKCPTTATRCPVVKTKCPAVTTRCPESSTKCPPTATKCQVVETQCPAVATKCPISLTKCPESLTKCPPVTTRCPPTVTQCSTLAAATQCPAAVTQCPPVATQCPPTPTNCQVIDTECPAVETKCPPVTTKCPPTVTQCSNVSVATQCPIAVTQCPPVTTQCPPVTTQCPLTVTQCSGVTAATQCPAVATRCPVVTTQCPPTATQCPVVDTECPAVETKCPPVTSKCPPTVTQCAVFTAATQCPVVATQCPPVSTKCPPTATECQAVDTQCPAVATRCPPVTTQCPPTPTQCSPVGAATQCPVVATQCPPVTTQCPPVSTQCPVFTTRCPESLTKCPPTATLCQVVQTQCPAVQTQCPPVSTQCPAALTQCPATATLCQVVLTQCPRCIIFSTPVAAATPPPTASPCPPLDVICPTIVVAKR
jgi:hypothetical protein